MASCVPAWPQTHFVAGDKPEFLIFLPQPTRLPALGLQTDIPVLMHWRKQYFVLTLEPPPLWQMESELNCQTKKADLTTGA